MKKIAQIQEKKRVYSGFLKLDEYRLQHASYRGDWCPEIRRERLEGLSAVSVLPYDPRRDCVVLIEQFRIGALEAGEGAWLLETIGGYRAPGEAAEEVARREALEEADCALLELLPICEFYVSPGVSSERIALYCARVDADGLGGIHGLPHEGEEIRVEVLPAEQAIGELYRRVNSTSALIALQWFALQREQLRRRWGGA
jgi:ADP-ribose pyrophosphatase